MRTCSTSASASRARLLDRRSSPEGHLVRYGADDRVIGITVVNAKWLSERDGEITVSLRVDAEDLAPALA